MITKIRVMLVDDHNVVRSGLRRLLELGGDIKVVAEGSSGEQACQIYSDFETDVLVMDLSMPGMGGLEALRHILAVSYTHLDVYKRQVKLLLQRRWALQLLYLRYLPIIIFYDTHVSQRQKWITSPSGYKYSLNNLAIRWINYVHG